MTISPGHRIIIHVDMDAFYASVEERDRPELRGKPVIIGADPQGGAGRGVVSTANYAARKFGVGSAMPISTAYKLCPQGIYFPPDMKKYAAASRIVRDVFESFTDLVEPLSLDEAFLDVSGSVRLFGDGETIARKIKSEIRARTKLSASAGVATAKLVAKIASDLRKPDGLVVVSPGTEAEFLAPLPVRKLWGVGPKMEERLAKLGIHTIGQLAQMKPGTTRVLGTHGLDLQRLALGQDERAVIAGGGGAKSVSVETTFDTDQGSIEKLRATLLSLADDLGRRLRGSALRGRTITLKYRDETFRTKTRARSLAQPTNAANAIFDVAWSLFEETHGILKVRLLGIGLSGFDAPKQRSFFDADDIADPPRSSDPIANHRIGSIDAVRDQVRERFGGATLVRASALVATGTPERGSAPKIQPSRKTKPRT